MAMAQNDPNMCTGIFQKTKFCKFKKLGICNRGAACTYAHSQRELQPLPDLFRTKMCFVMSKNGKCKDPKCPYAHTKQELRTISFDEVSGVAAPQQEQDFSPSPYCPVFMPVVNMGMPWMGQYSWDATSQSTMSGDDTPFNSPISSTDSESFMISRQTTATGGEDASCSISQASTEETDTWGVNSSVQSIENNGDEQSTKWKLVVKNTFIAAIEQEEEGSDSITTSPCMRRCSSSPTLRIS
jgi:hypothetical protein